MRTRSERSRFARIFVALAGLHLAISFAHAAAGDLDLSFAGTGKTRIGFGFGEDFASAVAVQPDGKLLVAGSSGNDSSYGGRFAVLRYGTDDALDPSFGEGGKVITLIPNTYLESYAQAHAMQIQPDGKIVVAGWIDDGTNTLFTLVRYHSNGTLDDTFGTGGITTTAFGNTASLNAMVIQPDGKILVGGTTSDGSGTSSELALARYTTAGGLDLTFGNSGKVVSNFRRATANSLALQSSGKILVAGSVSNHFSILRYSAGGVFDTTFGGSPGNGLAMFRNAGSSFASALAIQPGDGVTPEKILVVGSTQPSASVTHYNLLLARLDVNGFTDFNFGFFGSSTYSFSPSGNYGDFPQSILISGTGSQAKILVSGFVENFGTRDAFFAARFNNGGSLDPSFDGDGKAFTFISPSGNDDAYTMAFVPNNKLMVVGTTTTSPGNHDFGLARYNLSDGTLDASFDQDGKKAQDVSDRYSAARGAAIQPDGKIVVAGSCYNGADYNFALARFHPTGAPDLSFGVSGKVVVPFGDVRSEANAVALQPDGKIVAVGAANGDFAVVRLNTNGTLDVTFDGDGIVTTLFTTNNDQANAITLQPDGRIVVAGSTYNGANFDFAFARYRTNGALDTSFNLTGKATVGFGTNDDSALGVRIQSDGKIVASGYAVVGGRADVALTRLNTNGTRDLSFGTNGNGRVTTAVSSQSPGFGLEIQPNGKFLVPGYSLFTDVDGQIVSIDLIVMRYNTNGVPDNTFGSGGLATMTSGGGLLGTSVALQPDGKVLVGGIAIVDGEYKAAVTRFLDIGVIDADYGDEGTAIVESFDAGMLVTDALGRAIIAGGADGVFGIARLQTDPVFKILSVVRQSNRHAFLTGVGAPLHSHTLLTSTNVTGGFSPLGNVIVDNNGRWQFDDAGATNLPRRFYRLVSP